MLPVHALMFAAAYGLAQGFLHKRPGSVWRGFVAFMAGWIALLFFALAQWYPPPPFEDYEAPWFVLGKAAWYFGLPLLLSMLFIALFGKSQDEPRRVEGEKV